MSTSYAFEDLTPGHFGVMLLDVPARFNTYDRRTTVAARATATRPEKVHYETMTDREIMALPVADYAAKDCALLYWTSGPFIPRALAIIGSWGFEYKTTAFVWVKPTKSDPTKFAIGGGLSSTRANAELVLLATRGRVKRLHADVPQIICEPRREHSRKPDIYDRIERLFAGPYAELFARQEWPGWHSHGDQRTLFKPSKPTVIVPEIIRRGAFACPGGATTMNELKARGDQP